MSGCHSNNKYSELKLSFDNVILVIQQFRQQIIRNIWKDIRAEEETSPRRERERRRGHKESNWTYFAFLNKQAETRALWNVLNTSAA